MNCNKIDVVVFLFWCWRHSHCFLFFLFSLCLSFVIFVLYFVFTTVAAVTSAFLINEFRQHFEKMNKTNEMNFEQPSNRANRVYKVADLDVEKEEKRKITKLIITRNYFLEYNLNPMKSYRNHSKETA